MKKIIFIGEFALLAAGAVVLFLVLSSNTGKTVNPNLMTAVKTFDYPGNAGTRFKSLLEKNGLDKIFKKDIVNTLYQNPGEKWSGRVKYSGVSYHALFAVDNSTITFKLKQLDARALSFSIFNPGDSRMLYKVTVKNGNRGDVLYKEFLDKKTVLVKKVKFPRAYNGETQIILETQGKGVGAWLNPMLNVQKKNPKVFIVIVLDTLRYDHTSLYGYSRKTTPVLDGLGREAVVFRDAYSTTSWTLPAHVSLFSGKDPDEHGVVTPTDNIPGKYPLVSEVFQQNGYVTAAFTGGGFIEDSFGFYRGFQLYSNNPGSVFSKNSAERVFDHFKNYIDRFPGNDLFVFLHTYQCHAPYKAPHDYIDQIDKGLKANMKGIKNFIGGNREYFKSIEPADRQLMIDLYDASILYCDKALVGGVVNYLKEKGLYDDTMLVVLSDHGEEFYDHHSWEHGHSLYRELIQVPLLIKYPRGRKKGKDNALVSITDIPGLMLKESGLAYDKTVFRNEIGRENRVLPVLLPLSPIIGEFPPKVSFVDNNFHFIFNIFDKKKQAFFDPPPPAPRDIELYEKKDYLERTNLAGKRRHIVDRFAKLMDDYLKRVKGAKMETFKLNKELEEKLKSLGYLGGK